MSWHVISLKSKESFMGWFGTATTKLYIRDFPSHLHLKRSKNPNMLMHKKEPFSLMNIFGFLRSFLELAKVPLDSFFDISLRCGGNLSSLYLLQYIKYIEKKHKKTVNKIDFRSKDYGAKINCTKITFSDYSSFYANGFENGYISLLGSRFVRPSCFLCSYNGYLVSDFVLGDVFHGIPRKKGTSFVGVLSEKGARFLACLISRGGFCEFDIKDSPQIQEFRHEKSCLNLEELFKEQTLFYEQSSSDFSSAYKLFVYSGFSRRQRLYSRMPYIFKRWITK